MAGDGPGWEPQRKAARRTVLVLALVSLGFYIVFFLEHYFFH